MKKLLDSKKSLQLPGTRSTRALHYHRSDTPTSSRATLIHHIALY